MEQQRENGLRRSRVLTCVLQKMAVPVIREWPFILVFLLMMGIVNALSGQMEDKGVIGNRPSLMIVFSWISIWFLVGYVLAAFMVRWRAKWLRLIIFLVVFIMFAIQHFLMQNYYQPISSITLVLLAETNSRESEEFIKMFVLSDAVIPTLKMLLAYVLFLTITDVFWKWLLKCLDISKILSLCITTLLLPLLLFGIYSSRVYIQMAKSSMTDDIRFLHYPKDPFSCLYSAALIVHSMSNGMQHAVEVTKLQGNSSLVEDMDDSLNVVLVIGESYIKHHSPLYGYALNTTPFMKKEQAEGRLFVFDDVVTTANKTTVAIKNMLSCNDTSNKEVWSDFPYFPAIFKKAGYEVYFWDNQRDVDPHAEFSFTLNSYLYDPTICELSYTKRNGKSYHLDGEIVTSFCDSVNIKDNKYNLVLFHLVGQHFDFNDRFPHIKEFECFTPDSINRKEQWLTREKKQQIANYDNATLYNDYVISRIADTFANSNTFLVYLPDHGEEVFDFRDRVGRDFGSLFFAEKLKYEYEIPFVIWCSNNYKNRHPQVVDAIRHALNRPFMNDNICHMLFNIGGIRTSFYRAKSDLLSPSYQCARRLVEGQENYIKKEE